MIRRALVAAWIACMACGGGSGHGYLTLSGWPFPNGLGASPTGPGGLGQPAAAGGGLSGGGGNCDEACQRLRACFAGSSETSQDECVAGCQDDLHERGAQAQALVDCLVASTDCDTIVSRCAESTRPRREPVAAKFDGGGDPCAGCKCGCEGEAEAEGAKFPDGGSI